MKRLNRALLFILTLLPCAGRAQTFFTGTFNYPNGSPVSGTLSVVLESSGIYNVCSTPAVIVPTAPRLISIVAGAITGSPSLVPTDCLSKFKPYLVQLYDSNRRQLFSEHWFISQPS